MVANETKGGRGASVLAVVAGVLVLLLAPGLGVQAHWWGGKLARAEAELRQAKTAYEAVLAVRTAELAKLRKRLKQDEDSYAQLLNDNEQLRNQVAAGLPAGGRPVPEAGDARRSPAAWMERLRQEDPERFQQFTQARQQRQQAVEEAYKEQAATLAQRAKNAATPAEAEVLAQVTATLDQIQQLRQSRSELADLSPEERQAQAQQMGDQLRQAYENLDALREQDRTVQAQNLAAQLGLRGQSAQAVLAGVTQIYRNTQYTAPHGRGGFGGGGPGMP